MGKIKSRKNFQIGDFVFAKVRGYPAWPAKIVKSTSKKYGVNFYGTGQIANIIPQDLFMYSESKRRFAQPKHLKMPQFREAVRQIECAIRGEVSAPVCTVDEKPSTSKAAAANSLDRTLGDISESSEEEMTEREDYLYVERSRFVNAISDQETSDEELAEREDHLSQMERSFVEVSLQVHDCLVFEKAHVDRCIKLLEQYKYFELNKFMLLRNPNCVDVIRRIRHYVGNLEHWQMREAEEMEFKKQARVIRKLASNIYEKFKKLIGPRYESCDKFWEEFSEEVKIYELHTKNLTNSVRLTMSEKSYDALVEKKTRGSDAASDDSRIK